MNKSILALGALALLASCAEQPNTTVQNEDIRLNQVGYYPQQQKLATILIMPDSTRQATSPIVLGEAQVVDAASQKVIWTGKATANPVCQWANYEARQVDFSAITTPGEYVLRVAGGEQPFTIKENALRDVTIAGLKAFYLQRTGVDIEEQYAGVYARPAAHPDTHILVHPSAATPQRKAGTVISSPGGWYDAGDFNKYIVNSAFTVAVMLRSYEQNPDYYKALEVNIPESGNQVPDILDEIMFNLKWMLTMQDLDGGVYHKLTNPSFEGFIMPADAKQPRYVVQKSTAAALDFAASMAIASRVYADIDPDFSAQAIAGAKRAFDWVMQNPAILYDQPGYSQTCKPEVSTGMYDDEQIADEFFWAATEMYAVTGEEQYRAVAIEKMLPDFERANWKEIGGMGVYTWLERLGQKDEDKAVVEKLRAQFLAYVDNLVAEASATTFHTPYGVQPEDYMWGSNSEGFAENGIELLLAYRLTGDQKYLAMAQRDADYLLGTNGTGYCYVTGFGQKQVMHPHQRLSSADGIEAPLPGFLCGGPNGGQQDGMFLKYANSNPDESYMDAEPSYASNEIAINWNATLVALMGGIDAVAK